VATRLLLPALRWFFAGRSNVVLEEVSSRLRIGVRPFQRTRRQVLIHRLLGDPKVQAAVEAHAAEHKLPVPAVLDRVERYAREIVPAFNAWAYFRVGNWVGRKVSKGLYRVRLGYVDTESMKAVPDELLQSARIDGCSAAAPSIRYASSHSTVVASLPTPIPPHARLT